MEARTEREPERGSDHGSERSTERGSDRISDRSTERGSDRVSDRSQVHPIAALRTIWDKRDIDPKSVTFHRGTVVTTLESSAKHEDWHRTLPPLLAPSGDSGIAPLRLGEVLGKGGMGVVYLAEQLALGRDVAVKLPHADVPLEQSRPQLLREAKVTGLLEHPNIVPVYTLGRDGQGRPLIVMRRIQGKSWADILKNASRNTRAGDDYLKRHLTILQQVAMAVHFAHDKGIVHRDLKPENVMVCGYGEVYVADWGMAVSIRDPIADVPMNSQVHSIEGTPGYMAPEMAAGDGESIDARTDVYLLGAILHEILTSAPPHVGDDLTEVLESAFLSRPHEYGPEVPPELADVCRRAMQRFAEDRYNSAAQFSRAIEDFLDHRAAMELSAEARLRLDRLEMLVEEATEATLVTMVSDDPNAAPVSVMPSASTKREVRKLFNECRFAFEHALRSYPARTHARAGLRRAMIAMIEFEMARQAAGAAEALLRELTDPPEELAKRVKRAWADKRRNEKRLKQLERDQDTGFGARTRTRLVVLMAILWGAACVASGLLTRSGTFDVDHFIFASLNAVFLVLIGASVLMTRDDMLGNAANRRLSAISSLVFTGIVAIWLTLGALGISRPDTALVHTLMSALIWACAAVTIQRHWIALSVAQLVSFALIWVWPTYYYEILGLVVSSGSVVTNLWAHYRRDGAGAKAGGDEAEAVTPAS